jgi:hypothetical protein
MRRAVIVAYIGAIVALALLPFVTWELAVVGGWDAAALTFLATIWPIIARADSAHTEQLATREDQTRASATLILVVASVVSLLGVGFALILAGHHAGSGRHRPADPALRRDARPRPCTAHARSRGWRGCCPSPNRRSPSLSRSW